MADLVIFGAGDIARLAHVYFSTDSPHRVCAFTVDAAFRTGETFRGLPMLDFEQVAARFPPDRFEMFVAVGYTRMNQARADKYRAARALGYRLASYISSRCTWLTDIPPGDNLFVLEDNTVQPFVTIGSNVMLWSGNHIGHDAVIEDHVFISSHVVVSGHTRIGEASFLGVNATLRNGITLGARTLVGAGATILKNTDPDTVWGPRAALRFRKPSSDVTP